MKRGLHPAVCLAAAALLAGCQSIPPGAERGPNGTMAYYVQIDASPPGARVEANGQSIGNTPVTLKIFGDPDGTFHDFGSFTYVIQGLPLTTNQFPQTRVFGTGHLFSHEDRIPSRIYLDMTQPQPQPQYYTAPPPGYDPYYYGPGYYGPYYGPSFRFEFGGPRYYRRHW